MDDYAGRVLADRYRLPLPPSDEYELAESRAFDTYSGQEVLVRQVPLPELVDAEVIDADGAAAPRRGAGRERRRPTDPAVRRAIEAAQSAAQIPDHPRLDQVFDVFAEAGSLWIVSELIAARPLAALLAEKPLNPYRAAEIAADVLTAVRVLHGHGWTHRNITARTVLVCDDGRVVLTGLAAGAAEEALCGYAPVPVAPGVPGASEVPAPGGVPAGHEGPGADAGTQELPGGPVPGQALPGAEQAGSGQFGTGHFVAGPMGASADRPGIGASGTAAGRTGGDPFGAGPSGAGQLAPAAWETGAPDAGPAGTGRYAEPGPRTGGTPGSDAYGAGPGTPDDPGQTAGVPYGLSSGTSGAMPRPQHGTPGIPAPFGGQPALPSGNASGDIRAARAGAIAAYRAGARAAARVSEERRNPADIGSLPTAAPGPVAPGLPGARDADGAPAGPGAPGAPAAPYPPETPDQDWWSQPPHVHDDRNDDEGDDDEPPAPYRAELAGTWRDGPAPWNDSTGPIPAGGGAYGSGGDRGRTGPGGPAGGTGFGRQGADPGATGGGRPALPAGGDAGGVTMARTGGSPYPSGGSGNWHPSGARDALRADAQRQSPHLPAVTGASGGGRWDDVVASGSVPAYRGPATPLAAERARQARIAIVGAVTERWAPEQAGPVHENWQLAPPIGPSTDLWALGALLYRAVQGHAPYPEENAAELVQLVCAEPPAFAEECGPLRPVVESLLRQDPTERPDFEELRGWLRSLVRSAPEPEAGQDVVQVPSIDERLPIKRRRGELVRKRRGLTGGRHRHKRGKERAERGARTAVVPEQRYEEPRYDTRHEEARRDERRQGREDPRQNRAHPYEADELYERSAPPRRGSRSLGRNLLILILLLLVAAVAFAVLFLPKAETEPQGQSVTEASPPASSEPSAPEASATDKGKPEGADPRPSKPAATKTPPVSGPPVDLAQGYALRQDPEGFRIAVEKDWERRPLNDSGQVRYVGGDFTLIVVPGRDSVAQNGSDPMAYQRDKEPELQPFRDSSWSSAAGLRRIDVGRQAMAEGQFTWTDNNGREVYVRNLAVIVGGRYHVIQVIGPDSQRDRVSEMYQQATSAYQATG